MTHASIARPFDDLVGTRYVGIRTNAGPSVAVHTSDDKSNLEPRHDLIRHHPIGFDWANGSATGASQLALALLAHASGDDHFALKHYQVFKHEIVSRLPSLRWELTAMQVLQMLRFVSGPSGSAVDEGAGVHVRKVAIIRGFLPGKTHQKMIQASGGGRSARKAATRALLNLLGNKNLRRLRILGLQIELSVLNAGETQTQSAEEDRDSFCETAPQYGPEHP